MNDKRRYTRLLSGNYAYREQNNRSNDTKDFSHPQIIAGDPGNRTGRGRRQGLRVPRPGDVMPTRGKVRPVKRNRRGKAVR